MAFGELDIGTLIGSIVLEDQMSSALTVIESKLDEFAKHYDGVIGAIGIGAAGAVAAIGGITTSILLLDEKGSTIQGVTDSFDHLAQQAGTSGDVLRDRFSAGLKGTVDDMAIMQDTVRLLGSGMKVTGDQAELLGTAARALGNATGTDASHGLETLSTALLTG